MPVIPFPDRGGPRDERPGVPREGASRIHGTFRGPTGARGTVEGWFRLSLVAIDGRHLYGAGVITGELTDADGVALGVGSRRYASPMDVLRVRSNELVATLGPLETDLLGFRVDVDAFELRVPLDIAFAVGRNGARPNGTDDPSLADT